MINIAKLLKDCPKGTKLYSPLFGEVTLEFVVPCDHITVKTEFGKIEIFSHYGVYFTGYSSSECLLFPSKGQTWEGWKLHVQPKFKVGDWIVRGKGFVYEPSLITEIRNFYICELQNGERVTYTLNDVHKNFHPWSIQDAKDGDVITNGKMIVIFNKLEEPTYKQHIIAYVGLDLCGRLQITEDIWQLGVDNAMPATKEQSDLLFAKIKEAGYQWDADKKELRKIKPHYDIANFQPFDKVLVRDRNDEPWRIAFYGYYSEEAHYSHFVGTCWSKQCIPFNNDTKHLLGTTDMPSEEYINW